MAQVMCKVCRLLYDDTYRLTYCPHDHFPMHTKIVLHAGVSHCCHSVEELLMITAMEDRSSVVPRLCGV